MNFNIPSKKDMNKLYRLVKKVYKGGFFEFVKELGQHIFFIASESLNLVCVIDPYEKIDIFYDHRGLLTCHLLFSGDHRNIRTYGVTYFSIEKTNTEDFSISGLEYFLNKFKHYKIDERNYAAYIANKPGERSIVCDKNQVQIAIKVLEKLLVIQKNYKKMKDYPTDLETSVCIFDFENTSKKFSKAYVPLESFNFLPDAYYEDSKDNNYLRFDTDEFEVQSGILYLGEIHSFTPVESYSNMIDFEVCFAPIVLYGITDIGKPYHIIYTTPYEDKSRIFSFIIKQFFKDFALYDTIVTDNIFIAEILQEPLKSIGIEVKFEPTNPFNTFMSNFVMKVVNSETDIETIDEILTESSKDIYEIVSTNLDNLDELNESFFMSEDENIIEEASEDTLDDEFDDDNNGYIS